VLAVGLFAYPGLTDGSRSSTGLFLGGNGRQLGAQLLGSAVVIVWTGAVALLAFKALDKLPGCQLRVDKDAELLGLDFAHHDGFAYPELNKDAVAHFNEIKAAERRARARTAGLSLKSKEVTVRSFVRIQSGAKRRRGGGEGGEDSSYSQCSRSYSAHSVPRRRRGLRAPWGGWRLPRPLRGKGRGWPRRPPLPVPSSR